MEIITVVFWVLFWFLGFVGWIALLSMTEDARHHLSMHKGRPQYKCGWCRRKEEETIEALRKRTLNLRNATVALSFLFFVIVASPLWYEYPAPLGVGGRIYITNKDNSFSYKPYGAWEIGKKVRRLPSGNVSNFLSDPGLLGVGPDGITAGNVWFAAHLEIADSSKYLDSVFFRGQNRWTLDREFETRVREFLVLRWSAVVSGLDLKSGEGRDALGRAFEQYVNLSKYGLRAVFEEAGFRPLRGPESQ